MTYMAFSGHCQTSRTFVDSSSTNVFASQLERVVTALPETQSQLAAASERADLVLATVKQLEIRSMLTDQTLEEMEVRDGNNINTFLLC